MPSDTPTFSQWRARPVFISSTFKDMQAERDCLRSHVFPRLEEKLREQYCASTGPQCGGEARWVTSQLTAARGDMAALLPRRNDLGPRIWVTQTLLSVQHGTG